MAYQKQLNKLTDKQRTIIAAAQQAKAVQSDPGYYSRSDRWPAHVTTIASQEDSERVMSCWVNPSAMRWQIAQRGAIQKTRGGIIRYCWRNEIRKTFYDSLKVTIDFQAGNILPTKMVNAGPQPNTALPTIQGVIIPPGLDNFYLFMSLIDEPTRTPDNRENFHKLFHSSVVFPCIYLYGYFSPAEGISLEESAEGGWTVKWTSSMEVAWTWPKLNNVEELRRIYSSSMVLKPSGFSTV